MAREGDFVRHRRDPELLLEVIRVEDGWLDEPVLLVRDASGTRHPAETFKVLGTEVIAVPSGS